ncbi:MAG: hypothetical protein E7638_00940 [Ruminococcaceae bacterium]|nr:hypothetical protein [Oscillospiraceae bacterium]
MNKKIMKRAGAIAAAAIAALLLVSCNTAGEPMAETAETEADFPFPGRTEKRPDGTIDPDADSLDAIVIRTAEDLLKIGTDPAYPLHGDYALAADIDLSHLTNFTPIAGAVSECGIVDGANVFSGTFDGRGHTICGLTISVSTTDRVHVGLFGTVASELRYDPAVIKNLILKDAEITGPALGSASYAALIGQANGYVTIDNIALVSGKVDISNETGDLLGVASLIGQCRTIENSRCSNNNIHITNVFSNMTVIGDNNGRSNYTSGLIGRIRGSDLGTLANAVCVGSVTHEGGNGNAVSTGDSGIITKKNVYYTAGSGSDTNALGTEKSLVAMTNGKLPLDEGWRVERGLVPVPGIVGESPLFEVLDFLPVNFTGNENINSVSSNFILPDTVSGKRVKWLSGNEKVISIDGRIASVTPPKTGKLSVTLTAYTEDESKDYFLQVVSAAEPELISDFANHTLWAKNYPEGTEFTWIAEKMNTGEAVSSVTESEGRLQLTEEMDNCKITLKAVGHENLTYYNSSLPTLAITSPSSIGGLPKSSYAKGFLNVYTTEEYRKTEYDDAIQVKVRGNTTAYAEKRPLRIKLDTRADLFGLGKSKHWVLLANYYDRSNLRNKLSYDLGLSLGLAGCQSLFVNVIFNGDYCGLYLLCESIRVDENVVDIFNWEETAEKIAAAIAWREGLSEIQKLELAQKMKENLSWVTSGIFGEYTISDYYDTSSFNITGGYLIENDDYYDEISKFTTDHGMKLMVQSPEFFSTNKEMARYLKDYIQNMEDALYSPLRLSSESKHYTEYLDIDSFLDFFMVNQMFKNVELFYKSCFMYKDVDGLLTFGPIWDMDWSSGNHIKLDVVSKRYDLWEHDQSQNREYWYRALYNDPWFMVLLYERWIDIQGNLDDMMTQLTSISEEIADEAKMNFERWKYEIGSINWEVKQLRLWLENRREWMGEKMASPDALLTSLEYYIPSERIAITNCAEVGDCLELTVSVKDEETIHSCDILVNGTLIGEQRMEDGSTVRIEKSLLREKGKYNSIELIGKKDDGTCSIVKPRGRHEGSDMADSACIFYLSK